MKIGRATPPRLGVKGVLPDEMRRFDRPERTDQVRLRSCRWCRTGDLAWHVWFEEWSCTQCGWIESERVRWPVEQVGKAAHPVRCTKYDNW